VPTGPPPTPGRKPADRDDDRRRPGELFPADLGRGLELRDLEFVPLALIAAVLGRWLAVRPWPTPGGPVGLLLDPRRSGALEPLVVLAVGEGRRRPCSIGGPGPIVVVAPKRSATQRSLGPGFGRAPGLGEAREASSSGRGPAIGRRDCSSEVTVRAGVTVVVLHRLVVDGDAPRGPDLVPGRR